LSEGRRYSQSDESTGQTVDSYTSFGGAFMGGENSITGGFAVVGYWLSVGVPTCSAATKTTVLLRALHRNEHRG